MCGRTACTLTPQELCKACSVYDKTNQSYLPADWRDGGGTTSFTTCTNVTPTSNMPILLRKDGASKRDSEGEMKGAQFVIEPMLWGLIPPFYKGSDPKGHGYKTFNCRLEEIEEKATYRSSLKNGQRCVILCDGFYEWQTTKNTKTKQPYFVHSPQDEGILIWDRETWDKEDVWTAEKGWKGPNPLKIAGLYSQWTSTEGDTYRSFAVMTMESGKNFADIHHRIPAILETDLQVEEWLDSGKVSNEKAFKLLDNNPKLAMHTVSSQVNDGRNKDENLCQPVDPKKPPETAGSKFMSAWLSKGGESKKNS